MSASWTFVVRSAAVMWTARNDNVKLVECCAFDIFDESGVGPLPIEYSSRQCAFPSDPDPASFTNAIAAAQQHDTIDIEGGWL